MNKRICLSIDLFDFLCLTFDNSECRLKYSNYGCDTPCVYISSCLLSVYRVVMFLWLIKFMVNLQMKTNHHEI